MKSNGDSKLAKMRKNWRKAVGMSARTNNAGYSCRARSMAAAPMFVRRT